MRESVPKLSGQGSAFWDVFVFGEKGEWVGLRIPWLSMRRTASYLGILLVFSALGVTGWFLSRWQALRSERLLVQERLKTTALELRLTQMQTASTAPAAAGGAAPTAGEGLSFLPALGEEPLVSSLLALEGTQVTYDARTKEIHLSFEAVRQGAREETARLYWVLLVHGPQGLLSVPPALSSKTGELVQYHRGQALENFKIRRSVSARFKVGDFLEAAGVEPVFTTLLVYDGRGSLLVRTRQEIQFQRIEAPKGRGRRGAATE